MRSPKKFFLSDLFSRGLRGYNTEKFLKNSKKLPLVLGGLTFVTRAGDIDLTINVPVVYMVRYKVVLRGDYP